MFIYIKKIQPYIYTQNQIECLGRIGTVPHEQMVLECVYGDLEDPISYLLENSNTQENILDLILKEYKSIRISKLLGIDEYSFGCVVKTKIIHYSNFIFYGFVIDFIESNKIDFLDYIQLSYIVSIVGNKQNFVGILYDFI